MKWFKISLVSGALSLLVLSGSVSGRSPGAVASEAAPTEPTLTGLEKRQQIVIERTLDEYGAIKGRFARLADLEAEGYLFFRLRNTVTGEPLSESCATPVPGAACVVLRDAYTLETLRGYDAEGHARNLLPTRSGEPWRVIPEEERGKTSHYGIYRLARTKGYSESELKLVMLGVILSRSVSFPGGQDGEAAVAAFSREPLNEIRDPITGEWLRFSGTGYGDRVRIVPATDGSASVHIRVILDGKVIYSATVSPVRPGRTAYGKWIAGGVRVIYGPPLVNPKPNIDDLERDIP